MRAAGDGAGRGQLPRCHGEILSLSLSRAVIPLPRPNAANCSTGGHGSTSRSTRRWGCVLGQKTFSGESWPLKHPSGPRIWLGSGNEISLYREGGIKLSRKHLQAACRKGTALDYQLLFLHVFQSFSPPLRGSFISCLLKAFRLNRYEPVCKRVSVTKRLLFAQVMLA